MAAPLALVPPARDGRVVRPGGRVVGWTEWGAVDGAPVVFCTGAAMTSALGFGADVIDGLGVRLICVDRAGLGRSAPDPDKSFASYAADVAAVLAALGLAPAPAVGFSQGAPFAVALAAAGVAPAIALVAGTDELAHPQVRPRLPAEVGGMIDAIAADRAGFEAAFAARVDADGLWGLIVAMSAEVDRARYQEPGFAAAYRAALHDGFAQGPAGYVRDLTLASSRWPTAPEDVGAPVALWYGALDTSPVHSPDHGATLAARFPRATRHVVAGEGGAILWTGAGAILADLLGAVGRA